MKPIKFAKLLVLALILTVAASGCKTHAPSPTPLPKGSSATSGGKGETGLTPGRTTSSEPVVSATPTPVETTEGGHASNPPGSHEGWIEDPQALKADTVHFDFDSSIIKDSEKPKVAAVADYLKANAGKAVRVEGNCDERGTEEYNRALGERRALAVREELISLGISPKDVDTKSWGKDNPANEAGHDEAAWKQNRRDDFVVLTEPGK